MTTGYAVPLSGFDAAAAAPIAAPIAVVAQPTPPPEEPGGRGEDFGKSTPVGLVVLIVFFIAVYFLVKSMNKHLRRVPESFDPPEGDGQAGDRTP